MYLFGLDCSTRVTGMAIVDDSQVVAEIFLHNDRPHSKRLMPAMEQLFSLAGLTLQDMHGLAIATGPGSFTGLRIGMATIKGMAQPLGLPIVGVPTLDALARNAWPYEGIVCPILDARKSEVYTCLYRSGPEEMEKVTDYQAIHPEKLMEQLRSYWAEAEATDAGRAKESRTVLFVGDAVPVYRELFTEGLKEKALFAAAETGYPRGSQVARLGWERLRQGHRDDLHQLAPFYLRQSEAEVNWAKKQGCLPGV
ncbi:tRNA (adenosine(37)-N6)-threonylcarbamoyltransferase complex dimerization subunit type 1 TsaB [Heliobacillus mobilis]